jgi:hypothetical protein
MGSTALLEGNRKMTNQEIAKTIISQIQFADSRALWAWGAKNFVTQTNGVKFQVNGLKFKGHVVITLTPADTYTIELGKLNLRANAKNFGWNSVAKIEDIYCDNLMETIDAAIER